MSVERAVERNLGFFSEEEQEILSNSTVAIAGAGGDGGMLAIQLARLGVGNFRLADPDPFEEENLNRQAACTTATIGENKAVAVGGYIQSINPHARVDAYTEGITPDNAEEFVKGADLLIDETEFTIHAIGVRLARAAREEGVANLQVLNVGFGAQVTAYSPDDRKHSFERRLGLTNEMPIEEVAETDVDIDRWLAYVPKYVDREVFEQVARGEKSAPSVAPGVAMAASVGATQAVLHLLNKKNHREEPVTFPRTQIFDAMTGTAKTVKHPRLHFLTSAIRMSLRTKFNLNPKTSYDVRTA